MSSKPLITTEAITAQSTTANQSIEIKIPTHSFTAFRLMHGEPEEVSRVSQVVLLGSIPKLWFSQQKLGIIAKLTNQPLIGIKDSVTKFVYRGTALTFKNRGRLKKLSSVFKDIYDSTSEEEEEESDDSDEEDGNQSSTVSVDNQFSLSQLRWNHATHVDENPVTNDDSARYDVPKNLQSILHANTTEPIPSTIVSESSLSKSRPPISVQFSADIEIESIASFFTAQESAPKSISSSNDSLDTSEFSLHPNETFNVPLALNTGVDIPRRSFNYGTVSGLYEDKSSSLSTIIYHSTPSTVDTPVSTKAINQTHRAKPPSYPSHPPFRPGKSGDTDTIGFTSNTKFENTLQLIRPEPHTHMPAESIHSKEERQLENSKHLKLKKSVKLRKDPKLLKRRRVFNLISQNYSVGEVIKSQRMLVLVKMTYQLDPSKLSSKAGLENSDTRIYERWKEYIVVAKSSGIMDAPIRLEFLSQRREIKQGHKSTSLDFNLEKSCVIGFYSALDKTILIGYRNKIYVLSCQSPTTSIGWLSFLKETQGSGLSRSLRIGIPDMKISMNFNIPTESMRNIGKVSDRFFTLGFYPEGGYKNTNSKLVDYMSKKIRKRLNEAGYSDIARKLENSEFLFGMCWRHYDRLEWLYGESLARLFWQHSMNETHDLELRRLCHYPGSLDKSTQNSIPCLKEPPPVEGFISRLTTRSGSQRRGVLQKQVFKFTYLLTSSNLLFLTNAYKAIPPIIYSEEMMKDMNGYLASPENSKKIRAATPQIYYHNPFEFDEKNHFTWLKPGITDDEFKYRDLYAQSEYERKLATILRSEAVLNLIDVEAVRECDPSNIPKTADIANNFVWDNLDKLKFLPHNEDRDIFLEIVMKNGSSMILMSPNSIVRDEWISKLHELTRYWKERINQDMLKIKMLKESNIKKLEIDDWMEANINDYTEKWENSRGLTNPEVFNISSTAMFRPVIRNGELYQKFRKHSVFSKCFVVLVPGELMVYDIFSRSVTGKSVATTFSTHNFTIPLKRCYVFSGNLTALDLLSGTELEFKAHPGSNSTPRIYPDGWLSSDEDENVCFTLWFGSKRSIAGTAAVDGDNVEHDENNMEILRSNRDKENNKNPGLFKMVGRLGVTGKSMVFKCRSRQERDLWVSDLLIELDRYEVHNLE